MLVTRGLFDQVLAQLSVPGTYALDTETTGLDAYKAGDQPFSLIIHDRTEGYYFNLIPYPELTEDDNLNCTLARPHKQALKKLLASPHHLWVLHNAKFDMHMLARLGIYAREVDCTMIRERVLQNDRFRYSLDAITGAKDDGVRKHVMKHKLYTDEPPIFASKGVRRLHYDKAPLAMIHPYGVQDGKATIDLWTDQEKRLEKMERIRGEVANGTPSIRQVLDLERKVLPIVFNMEKRGILIDRPYAVEAYNHERGRIEAATAEFKALAGFDYDGREAVLGPWIESQGFKLGRTADGSFAMDADALESIPLEPVKHILTIRDAHKRAYTFWAGILERLDNQGRLHADFKQAGTATGRFSCADPNLQNLPKTADMGASEDDRSPFPIRKAFIPPPGYSLFMPDYEQMEYRLFMDLAGQMDVIEAVLGGKDVHTATADLIGRSRSVAKQTNFLLIYGGGDQKLADFLRISLDEAKAIRASYLAALPNVRRLVERLKAVALQRGWLINWYGRPVRFNRDTYYRAPNHFIQGGCADVVKLGMVRCGDYLRRKKSHLVSQIHDELWFYIHESENSVCEPLCDLMATAYPKRYLPMAVDPSWSATSAFDKQSGLPGGVA